MLRESLLVYEESKTESRVKGTLHRGDSVRGVLNGRWLTDVHMLARGRQVPALSKGAHCCATRCQIYLFTPPQAVSIAHTGSESPAALAKRERFRETRARHGHLLKRPLRA